MAPTPGLIDVLYREEVLSARTMLPEDKFRAGGLLFDVACSATILGIRLQHPGATDDEVRRILAERIALGRRLDQVSQ